MRGAGSLYLIFVGLLFCAAGGVFAWLMWRSYERASAQLEWLEVDCEIIESRVEERKIGSDVDEEFRFAVLYGYEVGAEAYTSERYDLRGSPWSGSRARAERLAERFPEGSVQKAYVDPSRPTFAVIKKDSRAPGYSLWFPLLIVVGGLGIIVGALRGLRGQGQGARSRQRGAGTGN
jgi:hypothetical protein